MRAIRTHPRASLSDKEAHKRTRQLTDVYRDSSDLELKKRPEMRSGKNWNNRGIFLDVRKMVKTTSGETMAALDDAPVAATQQDMRETRVDLTAAEQNADVEHVLSCSIIPAKNDLADITVGPAEFEYEAAPDLALSLIHI